MARIRTIKPEFWKDEELAQLPRDFRLLYIGLWNEADDEGRARANAGYLKGVLFPYDEDFGEREIAQALTSLSDLGKVHLYESGRGEQLLVVNALKTHQKIDTRYPSKLPAPAPYKKRAIPNQCRIDLAIAAGAAWTGRRKVPTKCAECGTAGMVHWMTRRWVCFDALEIDHVIPEAKGGPSITSNLQLLCRACNRRKAANLPPVPAEQSAAIADCPPQEQGTGNREQGKGGGNGGGAATPISAAPPEGGRNGSELAPSPPSHGEAAGEVCAADVQAAVEALTACSVVSASPAQLESCAMSYLRGFGLARIRAAAADPAKPLAGVDVFKAGEILRRIQKPQSERDEEARATREAADRKERAQDEARARSAEVSAEAQRRIDAMSDAERGSLRERAERKLASALRVLPRDHHAEAIAVQMRGFVIEDHKLEGSKP